MICQACGAQNPPGGRFCQTCGAVLPISPVQPGPYAPAQPYAPRTSGFAVAALVAGIVAPCTCGLSSVLALVFGLTAMAQIRREPGTRSGAGMAIAGVVLGSAGLLFLLAMAAQMSSPQFRQGFSRGFSRSMRMQNGATCLANQRAIAAGMTSYAQDYDERLPNAGGWQEQVTPYVAASTSMECALFRNAGYSFAMNRSLSEQTRDAAGTESFVLTFEQMPGPKESGDAGQLNYNHPKGSVIAFTDGHVALVGPTEAGTLQWIPLATGRRP